MARKNKKKQSSGFSYEDRLKMLSYQTSFPVKEAYNTIRTNLLFLQNGEKCPVFVITSPVANNGKTINSINLAIDFAQMGKKVLLIDSDMRNPTVHRMFNIPVKDGLSEILAGITDNISVTKTDVDNLSVLTAGKIPPNPTELLSSPKMAQLLEFVKQKYDCIFIDTPPINVVTDPTMFADKSTGYIIIIKTDTTNIGDAKTAVETIRRVNGNVIGFILNDITSKKKKYYSYYKRYNYKYNYDYNYNYSK